MSLVQFFRKPLKFKFNPDAVTDFLTHYLFTLNENSNIRPMRLFIYPTALCNDSCKYCSDGINVVEDGYKDFLKYNPKEDFFNNRDYIDKLIKDIEELKIRDVHIFGGGEPFFYKENMFYFLEKLKKVDVFIRIITNAKNLDGQDVDRIIKNRLISQLNISFNSDSELTAKNIYIDSSRHTHTINILKSITECKEKYQTDFPKIDIMFTILNVNYDKIIEVINLLKEFKINHLFFQPLRCYSGKQNAFLLSENQKKELLRDISKIEEKLGEFKIRSNFNEFKREGSIHYGNPNSKEFPKYIELKNKYNIILKCYMPLTTISICYNGNIPFCQFKYDKGYRQNYFDIRSLKKFIRSKEFVPFVRNFINNKMPEICADCHFCVPDELEIIKKRFLHFSKKSKVNY